MKLRLLILMFVLAGSSWVRAANLDDKVDLRNADYRKVRGLQWLATGSPSLPADGASKGEMLLALADLGAQAGQGSQVSLWKESDYETLSNLLAKYRSELGPIGVRQEALDQLLTSLELKLPPLENRMKVLPPAGFRMSGYFTTFFDDLAVSGPGFGPLYNGYQAETGYLGFSKLTLGQPAQGPVGAGTPARFRHAGSRMGMIFSAAYGLFNAALEYDLQTEIGDFDTYPGIRWLKAELRTPVALQFGNLDMQWTPLTFWRNEDEQPFEPEPYASRRQRLRDEALVKDHAWNLKGLKVLTDVDFLGKQRLNLEGFVTVLNYAGSILYSSPNGKTDYSTFNDTYLAAWKAELPVRLWGTPSVDPATGAARSSMADLNLGYIGTKVWDLPAGNVYGNRDSLLFGLPAMGFDSQVHSGTVELDLFKSALKIKGELAESAYSNPYIFAADPVVGLTGYLTDTAMTYEADLDLGWLGAKAWGMDNGPDFVSSPAQGRSTASEYSAYGPFPTEDVQFNPRTGRYTTFISYGSSTLFDTYPAWRYLDYLIPPQYSIATVLYADKVPQNDAGRSAMYNYLLSYDPSLNNSLPYGLATPNRQGFGYELNLNLWKGTLKPLMYGSVLSQSVGDQWVLTAGMTSPPAVPGTTQPLLPPNTYTVLAGGVRVDLDPAFGLPVNFVAGYKSEDTQNGDWVAFDSTLLDAGFAFKYYQKTTFSFGYRHLDSNGTLFKEFLGSSRANPGVLVYADLINLPPGKLYSHLLADTWGGSMLYQFTPRVSLLLEYTDEGVTNVAFPNLSLEVGEGYAKFLVLF
jgi:hypothetical protein